MQLCFIDKVVSDTFKRRNNPSGTYTRDDRKGIIVEASKATNRDDVKTNQFYHGWEKEWSYLFTAIPASGVKMA